MANQVDVVESESLPPVVLSEPALRNGIAAALITGVEIANHTIFAKQLVVGEQSWIHNITWTATDYNTATWSSGTLTLADGKSYSISGSNTGNISSTTYVYFDAATSQTSLQMTTTYSTALGENKILLAIVEVAGDTAAKCVITAFNSLGTTIDGDKIVTGKIQSTDGKTYFDLDGKKIVVNDGTNDRILIGYQSGGF